jgi:hypothetical protein
VPWLAYSGSPVLIEDALYTPAHSLSIRACIRVLARSPPTARDSASAGMTASLAPACFAVSSRRGMTKTSASSRGTSGLGCSLLTSAPRLARPFSRPTAIRFATAGRWLFTHNGFMANFAAIKHDLVLAVDESLYSEIKGQTDTEVLFYLALTLGLENNPPHAVDQADRPRRDVRQRRGVRCPFQGTIATSNGEHLWAVPPGRTHRRQATEWWAREMTSSGRSE